MHMVLIHKDSASSIVDGQKVFSHSLQAYLLRSTSELSGQMMDVLHLAPPLYLNDEDLPEPLLSDLPVISGKMLHKMHTQLAKAQFTALKCELSVEIILLKTRNVLLCQVNHLPVDNISNSLGEWLIKLNKKTIKL